MNTLRAPRFLAVLELVAIGLALAASSRGAGAPAAETLTLEDRACRLSWIRTGAGWKLRAVAALSPAGDIAVGAPSGEYTLLYAAEAPASVAAPAAAGSFPGPSYKGIGSSWREATGPVGMNTAGTAFRFYPQSAQEEGHELVFEGKTDVAEVRAEWRVDPDFSGDIDVVLTVTARKAGYYSMATPTIAVASADEISWAGVPGVFAGTRLNPDFVRAYGYSQGLPEHPVVARERTASTPASILSLRSGATLAVIAEPGTAADPWASDRDSRQVWRLGLSHMNRAGQLSPTLYHPVLGQADSRLEPGQTRFFSFRFVIARSDWYAVLRHSAYDIYHLSDFLSLKRPTQSLSDRLLGISRYLSDPVRSKWRLASFEGRTIGAQDYGSISTAGVVGSDRDAMKNSDYGAMWMLARMTGAPWIIRDRIPYARAFKLAQQQVAPGFFQGAAVGQYYLWKARRFTEEWGNYVEPIGLTYYTLCDLGNILLFDPQDSELRGRLRLGADGLLSWQHPDGHWEVAYDRASTAPRFTDLTDYRPTFYGLLVAYRILGDRRYLAGARRGADWLIENAVKPCRFLGVCGDARFAPDFATAQIAEALEELFEQTGEARYREAAVETARFYATYIYTYPMASNRQKVVSGVARPDWAINQTGLCFEHGGTLGSANHAGPILLASYAGMFVRMHQITGDPLMRDLARAGAWARDAFVDPATDVASYYWTRMNTGPGSYPHHAWWQIGWITDYLLSEAALRSENQITFPRGFFTPKVGPQTSYGFAPGRVFGEQADLAWGPAGVDRPEVDAVLARRTDGRRLFVILLNDSVRLETTTVAPSPAGLTGGAAERWIRATLIRADGKRETLPDEASWRVSLPPCGLAVLALDY